MNLRLILYSLVQCFLLVGGQVTLKLAMMRAPKFQWTWPVIKAYATDWWFAVCGVLFLGSTFLWMYILKVFPFSQAYPLTSVSYVIGIVAAVFIFHETVPASRWIGAALILVGAFFMIRK